MLEAVETLSVTAQELSLFIVGQFRGFLNKVVRHAVSNGRNGTRIVRPPHQFVHPHKLRCFLNGANSTPEGIELVVEKPRNAA